MSMNIRLGISRLRRKMADVLVIKHYILRSHRSKEYQGLGDKTHRRVGEITDRSGCSQKRAMTMTVVVSFRTLIA